MLNKLKLCRGFSLRKHTQNFATTSALKIINDYNPNLRISHKIEKPSITESHEFFLKELELCKGNRRRGEILHTNIIKRGFLPNDETTNALFNFYSEGNFFEFACKVFDEMPATGDVTVWTRIIAGYVEKGNYEKAIGLFSCMVHSAISLGVVIFRSVLKGIARLRMLKWGCEVHAKLIADCFMMNLELGNGLLHMYCKCGCLDSALLVFRNMPCKDAVSCNTMISAYSVTDTSEEAMKLFTKMYEMDIRPDGFTFASILCACTNLASIEQGNQIHACIVKSGFECDRVLASKLIHMYAKCGSIESARSVFKYMPEKDLVCWTGILTAYGKHGFGEQVTRLFDEMQQSGVKADGVSYLAVLTACSHVGMMEKGWYYFNRMIKDCNAVPAPRHYACMVDLLGRAGYIEQAYEFIKNIPLQPTVTVWGALLGACQAHGEMDLGKIAAEKIMELDTQHSGAYVALANIHANAGNHGEANRLRNLMRENGIKKEPGCSWIEVKSKVHVFPVGGHSHPQIQQIFAFLEKLAGQMKEAGYKPMTRFYNESST